MSFSQSDLDSAYETVFEQFDDRDINTSFAEWQKNFPTLSGLPDPMPAAATESKPGRGIVFEGTLIVNGYVAGEICAKHGELVIDRTGEVDGDISVPQVTIYGTVRGDIRAIGKVELGSDARLVGDIETAELVIQTGAQFMGHCTAPTDSETQPSATYSIEDKELVVGAR